MNESSKSRCSDFPEKDFGRSIWREEGLYVPGIRKMALRAYDIVTRALLTVLPDRFEHSVDNTSVCKDPAD